MTLLQRWARRRQGSDGDQVLLHPGRVYILPTRGGLIFGLVFFTMLLGALNYSNNMGFALAFVLSAVAVVSIHHCQRNLAGLRVTISGGLPVFAGEPLACRLHLVNEGRQSRWQLSAGPLNAETPGADLAPGGTGTLELALPTTHRGRFASPPIRVSTRYPFGLFEAWSWLYPARTLVVYPRPADRAPRPAPADAADRDDAGLALRGSDEFAGLRQPLPGEPPSRMAWKAQARTGQLLAKDLRSGSSVVWIDWVALPAGDPEFRLAQLARQLIDAEAGAARYGLRLPGIEVAADHGRDHLHACLGQLAAFEQTGGVDGV